MKKKLLFLLLFVATFSCGKTNKESKSSDKTVNNKNVKIEVSEKVEVLRKGSEKTGYVTLTKDWEIVHRQEGEVEVIIFENSKKKEEYITLMQNTTDIYDINSMALSAYEKLTRNEEDAKYVKKLKESTLNGKKSIQLETNYPNETAVKNYTEHNGKIYMIEVAGPKESIETLFNIVNQTWNPDR
ncbi:MAG: hypothetical protein KBA67_02660 [Leptotrichiaceae bacterium]|nr:hypothetical protein [Leptotrichiaceae bacterium]MBP7100412.1 hypothetical protein [Leptotrichiaceae bacterium]MBP7739405.1 hypothetical protein [Leptotrichiaceae bacterium]MBP9629249.1 hypothetical protein [Leptotrichiaceae bacterium]